MSKIYKLIKKYPGSPIEGTDYTKDKHTGEYIYYDRNKHIQYIDENLVENNPEFFQEIFEKDYEILSVISTGKQNTYKKGEKILYNKDYKFKDMHQTGYWDIHSVKRLSDGQVFTIDDKVDSTISDLGRLTDLTCFKIIDNKLKVGLRDLGYYPLSTITKSKNHYLLQKME